MNSKENAKNNEISLQGYTRTTYDFLCEKLGQPDQTPSKNKNINCKWTIEFEDGNIGTIYDWKTKQIPKDFYNWQIGGRTLNILDEIEKILGIEVIGTPF